MWVSDSIKSCLLCVVYMVNISSPKRCPLWQARGTSETMALTWKCGMLHSGEGTDLRPGGDLGILNYGK